MKAFSRMLGVLSILVAVPAHGSQQTPSDLERFELSSAELSINVPRGWDRSVPQLRQNLRVDISALESGGEQSSTNLLRRVWIFNGPVWDGMRGMLSLDLRVVYKPGDADFRVIENLVADRGVSDYVTYIPRPIQISDALDGWALPSDTVGTAWIYYRSDERSYLVTGLTRRQYIVFVFTYTDNTRGRKLREWRPAAEKIEAAIVDSLKVAGIPILE